MRDRLSVVTAMLP